MMRNQQWPPEIRENNTFTCVTLAVYFEYKQTLLAGKQTLICHGQTDQSTRRTVNYLMNYNVVVTLIQQLHKRHGSGI